MDLTPEEIQLWFHYEEIAMHFNELIIQYRLQLMGGAGALGALASYFVNSKADDSESQHRLRALLSTGLFVLIAAAALLDIGYYNELLNGAVKAIIAYEKAHPEIRMSIEIADSVGYGGRPIIYLTYGLILLPLLVFMIWSWRTYFRELRRHKRTS